MSVWSETFALLCLRIRALISVYLELLSSSFDIVFFFFFHSLPLYYLSFLPPLMLSLVAGPVQSDRRLQSRLAGGSGPSSPVIWRLLQTELLS